MDQAAKVDRDATTPFLLKVFYRTGAFHRSVRRHHRHTLSFENVH